MGVKNNRKQIYKKAVVTETVGNLNRFTKACKLKKMSAIVAHLSEDLLSALCVFKSEFYRYLILYLLMKMFGPYGV